MSTLDRVRQYLENGRSIIQQAASGNKSIVTKCETARDIYTHSS